MAEARKVRAVRAAKTAAAGEGVYDVVVVGGGPAGSTAAWKLASGGLKTVVLDGAKFPREKVCGDYVEPRGLRILGQMGGLRELEASSLLPITHSATYIDGVREYVGRIPFYGVHKELPPCGYIVPRDVFDSLLLRIAAKAGAVVHEETYATGWVQTEAGVEVQAQRGGEKLVFRGRAVVGADGVNSVVARGAGILANDARYIALSQRAYAEGYEGSLGEAAFFFDEEFFPGYGWMFPMAGGRVNLGVGVLKETCQRSGISVPGLFRKFFEKLKTAHPNCGKLTLLRPPIGGIVKTYGSAGRNFFDRGVLIGDAGSFVDPMTGEGITPAMESALLGAGVVMRAVAGGGLREEVFAEYEAAWRGYFDPAMVFVDLCAATLRNPHYWGSWKRALVRGCALAQKDREFAATAGACFGGLEVDPAGILGAMWRGTAESLMALGPKVVGEMMAGKVGTAAGVVGEGVGWMAESWKSVWDDPVWHARWAMDVQRKWLNALALMGSGKRDARVQGVG